MKIKADMNFNDSRNLILNCDCFGIHIATCTFDSATRTWWCIWCHGRMSACWYAVGIQIKAHHYILVLITLLAHSPHCADNIESWEAHSTEANSVTCATIVIHNNTFMLKSHVTTQNLKNLVKIIYASLQTSTLSYHVSCRRHTFLYQYFLSTDCTM